MANLNTETLVTANVDYDIETTAGHLYAFTLNYVSGTGTVTVKREAGNENVYSNYKLPTDPTSDMALAASGTELGYVVRATGNSIRFTVSSASSLQLWIKWYEVPQNR